MNAKELYDYIVKRVSPEEALMRLLESASIQYEKLKFDKDSQVHPVIIITMAAFDMGWNIVIDKDSEEVNGIMTGTDEYIEKNLKI